VQALPVGLALAVVDGGLKLPAEQLEIQPPVIEEAQPVQPVTREQEILEAQKPIYYPPKQARN
jgi:hypothetical protein